MISQFALWGDSLTDGSYLDHATAQGGLGSWAELLAERLGNIGGLGPVLGTGYIGVGTGQQWSLSGGFRFVYSTAITSGSNGVNTSSFAGAGVLNVQRSTGLGGASGTVIVGNSAGTNATITYTGRTSTGGTMTLTGCTKTTGTNFVMSTGDICVQSGTLSVAPFVNKAPQGEGWYSPGSITDVATFTRPVYWRTPVGMAVYFIDMTGGGNWQYSIDGGTWTQHGQTITASNNIIKFYIPTTMHSDIRFRAYDGASNAAMFVIGVELFWTDPRTAGASGVIVHNFGINGWTLNDATCQMNVGDRFAILDSVTLGTGSPITNKPAAGIIEMFLANDYGFLDLTAYAVQLTTFYNRASTVGPVILINPWELGGGTGATQATYRAQKKTTGASLGATVHDFFDDLSGNGYGIVTTQAVVLGTIGYLQDFIHAGQSGHLDIATRMYWLFRAAFLSSILNSPSSYPVSGKQVVPAYTGAPAAPAYKSAPIQIVSQ